MFIAKTFSGLNQNALRYLLPRWMNAYSGVMLRLGVGALLFFLWGLFKRDKNEQVSWRDRGLLFLTGLVIMFGYMWTLLEGLTYTTPISSSIFISLQPVFTFIICLCMRTEFMSLAKATGISLGLGGAVLIVITQKTTAVATDPMLGNMLCCCGSILYAFYLVIEKRYLERLSNATVSKWTFFGGAVSAVVLVSFTGWDASVLTQNVFSTPMLVLLFILIFPTFISYLLTDKSLRILPATVVALYGNIILIVAAIASYILGQDVFDMWQPVAILMMIGSVYFVEVAEINVSRPPLE